MILYKLNKENTTTDIAVIHDNNGNTYEYQFNTQKTYIIYPKSRIELQDITHVIKRVATECDIACLLIRKTNEQENDVIFEFDVPIDWLIAELEDFNMALDEFLNEYTTEDSEQLYEAALLAGVTKEIEGYLDIQRRCNDEMQ